jgi:hypothetical protein
MSRIARWPGVVPLRHRSLFRRGIGLPEPARHFPGDGLRSAWPGRELAAQRIDVCMNEHDLVLAPTSDAGSADQLDRAAATMLSITGGDNRRRSTV